MRSRLLIALSLVTTLIMLGSSSSPEYAKASGPIKSKSGIHLGNRVGWNSTLLTKIDGEQTGGIWPKAVVFLSNQLYNINRNSSSCLIESATLRTDGTTLKNYLQRASQNGVMIIIRVYPSPGNFDDNQVLRTGPITGIGYCYPNDNRPGLDIVDEMVKINDYNQANGITGLVYFEPANEPNIEWYSFSGPVHVDQFKAWQDMNTYFTYVIGNTPVNVKVLAPPMAQGVFAEGYDTDSTGINDPDPNQWCQYNRILNNGAIGYDVMQPTYSGNHDGVSWHNYWRLGFEKYGRCGIGAQHVSYYFPSWLQNVLDGGSKPGFITEADLFSYKPSGGIGQDDHQPLQNKDNNAGVTAADSLRKFILSEPSFRTTAIAAWLLNDNVNSSGQDHNWHEAYNDQSGNAQRNWFTQWWSSELLKLYIPLVIR
jgi:hypothetical protein